MELTKSWKLLFCLQRYDEIAADTAAYSDLVTIVGGVPIRDPDNELIGALVTIRDVSAEDQLQQK